MCASDIRLFVFHISLCYENKHINVQNAQKYKHTHPNARTPHTLTHIPKLKMKLHMTLLDSPQSKEK